MNSDAIVLALLAIADLAFLVHLRQRHAKRISEDRMMASLKIAVHRANSLEELPPVLSQVPLQQAS
jgi:hypothetical protein